MAKTYLRASCLVAAGIGIGFTFGYGLKHPGAGTTSILSNLRQSPYGSEMNQREVDDMDQTAASVRDNRPGEVEALPTSVESEAKKAIEWLFGDGSQIGSADETTMHLAMAQWAKRDLEGAEAWLRENLDHPGRDAFITGMIDALPGSDPRAALEWVSLCSSERLRIAAWAGVTMPILVSNPDEAERLLANPDLSADFQRSVRNEWNHRVTAQSQRNAQNIVSVFGAAIASGATIDTNSVESVVEQLMTGTTGSGTFHDSMFKIWELEPWEEEMVKAYITILDDGRLSYDPAGK